MTNLPKTSLITKPFRLISWIVLFLSSASVIALFWLHQYHTNHAQQALVKHITPLLHSQITKKQDIGKVINIAYSHNSIIREAVANEDRATLLRELKNIRQVFSQESRFKNISMHLITADGRSLLRSYAIDSFNQDLTDHRLIKEVMLKKRAITGIDIGGTNKLLRLINITPIWSLEDPNEIVGYSSTSQGFRSLIKAFKNANLHFAVYSPQTQQKNRFRVDSQDFYTDSAINNLEFTKEELLTTNLHFKNGLAIYTKNILDDDNNLKGVLVVAEDIEILHADAWEHTWDFIALFALVLLLFASLLFALFKITKRDVIQPITKLDNAMDNIIKNKSFELVVQPRQNDEIGQVSDKFNRLLEVINELIHSLNFQQDVINQTLIISHTDLKGTITDVNDNFCNISGYSREELIGQPHNMVRHPDTSKAVFENVWKTIQAKKIWSGEIKNRAKNGSCYYVQSHIMPILDQHGHILEFMSIREDITDRVLLQERLEATILDAQAKKALAEKSNQAKSQFLSSMSHELRTPLNSIIGFSQLLEMSELSAQQKKQLHNISNSGKLLLHLINDLLELAKIESGSLPLSIENTSLETAIEETLIMLQSNAAENEITLIKDPASELNYFILADNIRLKQVLTNFLSNAIKYNRPQGSVTVHSQKIDGANSFNHRDCIRVSVTDTGLGIPTAKQPYIFEPFNRLGHENSSIEGTGIGLAITKNLIEQMGGQIGFDSQEGVGTTFWFEMPISKKIPTKKATVSNTPMAQAETVRLSSPSGVMTLLYIEDNPVNVKLMKSIIGTLKGYELIIANTAEQGIQKAQEHLPDIVFIDINLPDMNGDEVLPILKTIPELVQKNTLFYALTANAMKEDIKKGMDIGFHKYLTKPFNVQEIIELVETEKNLRTQSVS